MYLILNEWRNEQTNERMNDTNLLSKGPCTIVDIFLYDNSYHNSLTPSPLSLR